jgi:hypothetical protein
VPPPVAPSGRRIGTRTHLSTSATSFISIGRPVAGGFHTDLGPNQVFRFLPTRVQTSCWYFQVEMEKYHVAGKVKASASCLLGNQQSVDCSIYTFFIVGIIFDFDVLRFRHLDSSDQTNPVALTGCNPYLQSESCSFLGEYTVSSSCESKVRLYFRLSNSATFSSSSSTLFFNSLNAG